MFVRLVFWRFLLVVVVETRTDTFRSERVVVVT